jgi:hypothetical protein
MTDHQPQQPDCGSNSEHDQEPTPMQMKDANVYRNTGG